MTKVTPSAPVEAAPNQIADGLETQLLMLARWLEAAQRRQPSPMDRAAYLLLRRLQAVGPQTVAELAAGLGLDGSTVTRQLRALDRAGHIRRSRHPSDARAVVVAATDDGLAAADALRAYRQERVSGHFSAWPDHDQRELVSVLGRLNDVLRDVATRSEESQPEAGAEVAGRR